MILMSIVVGCWNLMEPAELSSVSMLKRLYLLYIMRLNIHARYTIVS
jgi:hypothetical protein